MHVYVTPTGAVYFNNGPTSVLIGVLPAKHETGVNLVRACRKRLAEHQGWPEVNWKIAVGISDEYWHKAHPPS